MRQIQVGLRGFGRLLFNREMDILFIQTEVESEIFYQIKTGISFHVTRKLLIDDILSLASGHLLMGFFPVKLKTNCNIKHSVVSGFF